MIIDDEIEGKLCHRDENDEHKSPCGCFALSFANRDNRL
jgi:hypothetical protein